MSGVRGADFFLQLADLKMSLFSRGKKRRQQIEQRDQGEWTRTDYGREPGTNYEEPSFAVIVRVK